MITDRINTAARDALPRALMQPPTRRHSGAPTSVGILGGPFFIIPYIRPTVLVTRCIKCAVCMCVLPPVGIADNQCSSACVIMQVPTESPSDFPSVPEVSSLSIGSFQSFTIHTHLCLCVLLPEPPVPASVAGALRI